MVTCVTWDDLIFQEINFNINLARSMTKLNCLGQLLRNHLFMNEWGIYIALHLYKALYSHGGGVSQPPPVCSIHLDDVTAATALTTHQLQVEKRESHRANQVVSHPDTDQAQPCLASWSWPAGWYGCGFRNHLFMFSYSMFFQHFLFYLMTKEKH